MVTSHVLRNPVQITNPNSSKYGFFSVKHKTAFDWNESLEQHPTDALKEPKTKVIAQIIFSPRLCRLRQLHRNKYTIAFIPSIYHIEIDRIFELLGLIQSFA